MDNGQAKLEHAIEVLGQCLFDIPPELSNFGMVTLIREKIREAVFDELNSNPAELERYMSKIYSEFPCLEGGGVPGDYCVLGVCPNVHRCMTTITDHNWLKEVASWVKSIRTAIEHRNDYECHFRG